MTFAYLDIETTGLDLLNHDVIEVAWAIDDGPIHELVLEHDIEGADPKALEINGYFERGLAHATLGLDDARDAILADLRGKTIVGSNPGFDIARLRIKLGVETWHYRSVDVSAVGSYLLGHEKPLGLAKLVELLNKGGFIIESGDHTARGDVDTTRIVHSTLREMASNVQFLETVRENIALAEYREEIQAKEEGE